MRAAVLSSVDGAFELRDVPEPDANGRALVHVRAAGINFADVLIRRGRYPQMPELPVVLKPSKVGPLLDQNGAARALTGLRRIGVVPETVW